MEKYVWQLFILGIDNLDEALTKEAYAIAHEKGDEELTKEINKALEELKADGTLAKIFEKYDLPYDAE